MGQGPVQLQCPASHHLSTSLGNVLACFLLPCGKLLPFAQGSDQVAWRAISHHCFLATGHCAGNLARTSHPSPIQVLNSFHCKNFSSLGGYPFTMGSGGKPPGRGLPYSWELCICIGASLPDYVAALLFTFSTWTIEAQIQPQF